MLFFDCVNKVCDEVKEAMMMIKEISLKNQNEGIIRIFIIVVA